MAQGLAKKKATAPKKSVIKHTPTTIHYLDQATNKETPESNQQAPKEARV